MFIPKINTISFARLYHDHAPIKVRLDSINKDDSNLVTVTIFFRDNEEAREININHNGFRFFDIPLDADKYFVIVSETDNSYDAVDTDEHDIFMDINEALDATDNMNKKSDCYTEYHTMVKRLS